MGETFSRTHNIRRWAQLEDCGYIRSGARSMPLQKVHHDHSASVRSTLIELSLFILIPRLPNLPWILRTYTDGQVSLRTCELGASIGDTLEDDCGIPVLLLSVTFSRMELHAIP